MKQPSFFEGVAVAIVLSILGSAFAWALSPVFGRNAIMYLLISGISFVYVMYLLARSRERVGRITTVVLWMAVTGLVWLAGLPWLLLGLIQVGFIWLVRSLYYYSSVLTSLMDLGLTVLSLVIAFWATAHSGSLFLGIWTFFLVQALFVAIPKQWRGTGGAQQITQEDAFQRAFRTAEAAVRKLTISR
jgi:hypothetical protein